MDQKELESVHPIPSDLVRRKPTTHPSGPPIPICISDGKAYIWAVDRTLPQLAQQNVFLGLPLQLMPEEVVTLVDLGIGALVDDVKSHRLPTLGEAAEYRADRDKEIEEERRLIAIRDSERRAAAKELYRSKIEAAEQRRRARQQQQTPSETENLSNSEDPGFLPPDHTPDQNQSTISDPSRLPYFVPIHLQSRPPTYSSEQFKVHSDLDSARQAGLWTYPHDEYQRARCAVFSALWRRGMFLGIGLKFGCDFLVYPGDSLRFHSHFACTVIANSKTPVAPLSLVSYGRLATAVKKAHLLACWDEATKTVKFLSLEWAGMG